jgi:HD-like signal output (HDOD) protein
VTGVSYDESQLQELIESINNLPSLPDVVYRVMDLVNDPDSSVSELVEVLLMDQAMTAKILRLANSPYYGFVRRIDTITQAVAVLGKNDIGDNVLGTALYGFMGLQGPGLFNRREFWEYSFACAQCTKILMRLSSQPSEQVYVMALLHDIGRLVIDECHALENDKIITLAKDNAWPAQRAEREILGYDHALVGGLLAQRWRFPPLVVDLIRNHHQRTDHLEPGSQESQVRGLLDLADGIVRGEGLGANGDFSSTEIPEEMWFPLGLNSSHLEKVVGSLQLAMNKLGTVLSA